MSKSYSKETILRALDRCIVESNSSEADFAFQAIRNCVKNDEFNDCHDLNGMLSEIWFHCESINGE